MGGGGGGKGRREGGEREEAAAERWAIEGRGGDQENSEGTRAGRQDKYWWDF